VTHRHEPHGAEADGRSVSDLVLERSRLGELPAPERDALARRIENEPELRARLAALEASDVELRRRLQAGSLAERVRARLVAQSERGPAPAPAGAWSRSWPLRAGLTVAASVLLALSLRTTAPTPATSEPGVRTKGLRPGLSLFRKVAEGSETLADGDVAHEGDVIRIGYHSLGRRYGVIVSVDGRGGVTRHFPDRGTEAAPLEAGDVVLLGHAYQLDDAPAWERFFFVTADVAFSAATVEEAARQVSVGSGGGAAGRAPADLPLPVELEQSTFLLTKEQRP
jgi:hypothetical protein